MEGINYKPIGIIHSPFTSPKGVPIQPSGAKGIKGTVEIAPAYRAGIKDLEGFSHIILLYHFHLSRGFSLEVKPFMDDVVRGVFATRAPKRPNPIGLSVVRLTKVENFALHIENVDVIDGTPLLDIKPYIPSADVHNVERTGWLTDKLSEMRKKKADNRFG